MYVRNIMHALPVAHAQAISLPSRGFTTLAWEDVDYGYMGGILDHVMAATDGQWDEMTVHSDGYVQLFYFTDEEPDTGI